MIVIILAFITAVAGRHAACGFVRPMMRRGHSSASIGDTFRALPPRQNRPALVFSPATYVGVAFLAGACGAPKNQGRSVLHGIAAHELDGFGGAAAHALFTSPSRKDWLSATH